MSAPSSLRAEEARIRAAYARRVEGDRYVWASPAYQHQMQATERAVLGAMLDALGAGAGRPPAAAAAALGAARILEVGCGTGHWLRALVHWGADPARLTGVDLQGGRLGEARRRGAPAIGLAGASGTALPFGAGRFDVVLLVTVLSSILDPAARAAVAGEARRVLAPGGAVVWYDFHRDNPRNPDVRGIPRAEVERLFPGCRVALRRTTLAPPLARLVAPRSSLLATLLALAPPLRTHHVGVIRP